MKPGAHKHPQHRKQRALKLTGWLPLPAPWSVEEVHESVLLDPRSPQEWRLANGTPITPGELPKEGKPSQSLSVTKRIKARIISVTEPSTANERGELVHEVHAAEI
jgi:hypothetical protein